MRDISDPVEMISGMPVVTAPAEIDATTADQLRMVLWGGRLVLLRPQQPVARLLALTGAEQVFTIRGGSMASQSQRARQADRARAIKVQLARVNRGQSRLLRVGEVGCSAASSAATCPIPS
jgi:hypothetical protein